jgi:hypothetical protein
MNLKECRQSCRVKVRIAGEEKVAKILMAHQHPNGLNNRPVGDRIHLEPGGWYKSEDVEFLEVLPWDECKAS